MRSRPIALGASLARSAHRKPADVWAPTGISKHNVAVRGTRPAMALGYGGPVDVRLKPRVGGQPRQSSGELVADAAACHRIIVRKASYRAVFQIQAATVTRPGLLG